MRETAKTMMWDTIDASRLVGSDGTRFAPFLEEGLPIQSFVEEARRSAAMTFDKKIKFHGLELFQYRIGEESLDSGVENPDNLGWHMYKRGVFNLTQISMGIPLIATKPHFLDADVSIAETIDGLSPDRDLHDTTIGVHKLSGVTMQVYKGLQPAVNTIGPLKIPAANIDWFPNAKPDTYIPIAYMIERGSMRESDAKDLAKTLGGAHSLKWFVSLGLLLISFFLLGLTGLFLWLAHSTKVEKLKEGLMAASQNTPEGE